MNAIDLNNLPRHKILETTEKDVFEKEINNLVASGWKPINIQTSVQWSENNNKFMVHFLCILVRAGIQ